MKKIAIVMFVVAAALSGCGKKKAPEQPATPPAGEGSAAPAEGSAAPAEGSAAPAEAPPAGG